MYIKNVKIKNFRCFDDISLEFKQGFNLVKGINGKGKTTMLEALAIGLNSFPECINKESFSMSISDDDIREQYNSYRKGPYSCNRFYPVEIDVEAVFGDGIIAKHKKMSNAGEKIYCACRSISRKWLAIAKDQGIEIWHTEDYSKKHTVFSMDLTTAMTFTPDEKTLIACFDDSTLRTIDVPTGMYTSNRIEMNGGKIESIYVCPDNETCYVFARSLYVKCFNLRSRTEIASIFQYHAYSFTAFNRYVYVGTEDGMIEAYEANDKEFRLIKKVMAHESPVLSLAISQDGKRLYSCSTDSTIKTWDTETGVLIDKYKVPNDVVRTLDLSSNDKYLVVGTENHKILIWDLETGKLCKTLYGAKWRIVFATMIQESKVIGFGMRDAITVWNLDENSVHFQKYLPGVNASQECQIDFDPSIIRDQYHHDYEILPVLCFQGAGRVWTSHEADLKLLTKKYTREDGYRNALDAVPDVQALLGWCIMMEMTAFQRNNEIIVYEAVKGAVEKFMGLMDHGNQYAISINRNTYTLMYTEGDTTMPIHKLSIGYQSLIWMVFDIAYRMALLNPRLENMITETPGIVLIDEIDIHLHPKWQWKVIDALRKTFPNVQFIATTHAPILFAASKDIWLIDIDQEKPTYAYSTYGLDINNSVDLYQGKYSVPEEVGDMVQRFYEAMDQSDYPLAKSILNDLEKMFTIETPLLVKLNTMYHFEVDYDEDE